MSKMDELARKVREAKLASVDAELNRRRHEVAYNASCAAEMRADDLLDEALTELREAALKEDA